MTDGQAVALGALIGLAGTVIIALITLTTNRINLEHDEARRHEAERRTAYPLFLSMVDALINGLEANISEGGIDDTTIIIPDDDWGDRLGEAKLMIDFVGSQEVITHGGDLMAAAFHLMFWAQRTGGTFERLEPPFATEDEMELMMIRSELNARRQMFANAARADLGLPPVRFFTGKRIPANFDDWFPGPTDADYELTRSERIRDVAWTWIRRGRRFVIRILPKPLANWLRRHRIRKAKDPNDLDHDGDIGLAVERDASSSPPVAERAPEEDVGGPEKRA